MDSFMYCHSKRKEFLFLKSEVYLYEHDTRVHCSDICSLYTVSFSETGPGLSLKGLLFLFKENACCFYVSMFYWGLNSFEE